MPMRSALGKVLIVAEDLEQRRGVVLDPDDEGFVSSNRIRFDFSAMGAVTMHSVTLLDVAFEGEPSYIELLDAEGQRLGDSPYPISDIDNNGVIQRFRLEEDSDGGRAPVPNVVQMVVWFRGSGAIDNVRFSPQIDVEMTTNGETADDVNDVPWIAPGEPVEWRYRVTNVGPVPLGEVTIEDSRGVEVSCPRERPRRRRVDGVLGERSRSRSERSTISASSRPAAAATGALGGRSIQRRRR